MDKNLINDIEEKENKEIIRLAKKEDAEAVWRIRNYPTNRQQFHHQEEISLDQHKKWFKEKYFNQKNNFCFVLEENGYVVGYCRFDFDGGNYLASIALDPAFQGKGLGTKLLGGATKLMPHDKDILAEIKLGNIPSLKIFEKNGFEVYKKDENNFYLKYKQTR